MAPSATSVTITGSKNVGGTLLGGYSYSDAEGDTEKQQVGACALEGGPSPLDGQGRREHGGASRK